MVPQFVMITWFSALVTSIRKLRFFLSPSRNALPSEPFKEKIDGPGITLRPAVPHSPAAGVANARILNPYPGVGGSSEIPVALARIWPVTPVPLTTERLPPAVAVSGDPVRTEIVLMKVQSLSSLPFHPLINAPPPLPVPLEYCHCALMVW